MDLNYFGTVHAVRAVLPKMKEVGGNIVLVSSGLALTGVLTKYFLLIYLQYFGYSTYAPTKYAIRGFGDCLRSELSPYDIQIYQAYPPAFTSPGFENENKSKPNECKAIEKDEPVHTPEDVADCVIDSICMDEYHISCGNFGINILTRITVGMTPRNNTLADMFLAPVLVFVSWVYFNMWDRIVKKHHKCSK